MPEISRFFGLIITMYYNDHQPAHFHARYAGKQAVIGIDPITVIASKLPPRALALAMEWAALHQDELLANWELARQQRELLPVAPLE
ncbi:MAG: DUF4160 domain-containing protein [Pirellulales bacterium]|nr:DUF4160 domain-containing protein [Pirellulales bacterium]